MEEEVSLREMPEHFFWYVTADDFDEEGNLNLDLSSGRLAHKWVPKAVASAKRFLLNSPDGEGLRQAHPVYQIVQIYSSEIKDITNKYPQAIPEGFSQSGMVIKLPFNMKLTSSYYQSDEFQTGEINSWYKVKDSFVQVRDFELSSLQMGLLSDEEIEEMSAMEVVQYNIMSQLTTKSKMEPVVGGLHDLRLGSLGKQDQCNTCNGYSDNDKDSLDQCPGHFGHIKLPVPIPKLLYLGKTRSNNMDVAQKSKPILHSLNSTCHNCHRIMIDDSALKAAKKKVMFYFGQGRRNADSYNNVRRIVKPLLDAHESCPHCNALKAQFSFKYLYAHQFNVDNSSNALFEGAKHISFEFAQDLLDNVPDDDCWFLGLNPETSHPRRLFFNTLPVAPNSARPLKIRGDGNLDFDDLTKLYQEVVYWADKTRSDARSVNLAEYRDRNNRKLLFYAVSRVTDNQTTHIGSGGSATRLGYEGSVKKESFKGVFNRLTGKKGRFRRDLQSKQVENTGRSVISPDPNLAIDEIGIPISILNKDDSITFPEIVTKDNIKELKGYIDNFYDNIFPQAVGVSLAGNEQVTHYQRHWDLERIEAEKDKLEIGMIVRRQLIRGDIALFSRAPHLHRQSCLAFRIIPIDAKGITMNPTVCIPFNADYDGDQMNVHFVQTIEAREEARKLMLLSENIIHARYGKLTVATDQDQTSGLYLLTHKNMRRANEWNPSTGVGFTDYGIPYFTRKKVIETYGSVYSQIRSGPDKGKNRTIETLPEPDYKGAFYTGRAVFSHLFDVIGANYVSATFKSNTPVTDEKGNIVGKDKDRVVIRDGKLLEGTIEKNAFGEGGSSIAPSFIYHEGYQKGNEKLCEYIELVTRLGLSIHINMGFSLGIADLGGSDRLLRENITPLYEEYAMKIKEVDEAYESGKMTEYAMKYSPEMVQFADGDPKAYLDIMVNGFTKQFDSKAVEPLNNEQGSSNAMQVSVRSKARGKPENSRQMGAAYGMTTIGGNRMINGINTDFKGMGPRALPHFPLMKDGKMLPLNHPAHRGFIKSNYATGMEPHEYWFTSTAGRRSTVESGEGNISVSGYLERKMVRALESLVVNSKHQVINTRTGRVISLRVGDDGLSPYHIRGDSDEVNKDGYTLTLQPVKFQFTCKHGYHLEESIESGQCPECVKGSDTDYFRETFEVKKGIPVSNPTIDEMVNLLTTRELYKVDLTKMSGKIKEFFADSLCRPGEAIGALAGQCLGEPATQAALRTFHFAGKLTATGDIKRIKQLVESPKSPVQYMEEKHATPRTIAPLVEGGNKEMAEKLKSLLTEVKGQQVIRLVNYDTNENVITINFDMNKLNLYQITPTTALQQVVRILQKGGNILPSLTNNKGLFNFQMLSDSIDEQGRLMVRISSFNPSSMLYAKTMLMNGSFNGIRNVLQINIREPEHEINEEHGRWSLEILSVNPEFLSTLVSLSNYVDVTLLETNNHEWVYKNYGLEAALHNIYTELDYQMNITEASIGEYDMRYIRTITDAMGELGEIQPLGPHGLGVTANPSIIASASLERMRDPLIAGSVMGNLDPILGVTESIATGKIPLIGDSALE